MKQDTAIRLTPRVYHDYRKSIAQHAPETAAILGGLLDKPNLITEFRFCPPEKRNGAYQSSSTYVSVDADLMNWIILNEWQPNGLYVLGFWHSHPHGVTSLSGKGGDIGLFDQFLQSEDARAMGWNQIAAPITTFKSDGTDQIHGWIYRRGMNNAESAPVFIHHNGVDYAPDEFEALCKTGGSKPQQKAPNRIVEAEFLMQDLTLASRRLQSLPGLSWRERLTIWRQFNNYSRFELDQMKHRMKSQPYPTDQT